MCRRHSPEHAVILHGNPPPLSGQPLQTLFPGSLVLKGQSTNSHPKSGSGIASVGPYETVISTQRDSDSRGQGEKSQRPGNTQVSPVQLRQAFPFTYNLALASFSDAASPGEGSLGYLVPPAEAFLKVPRHCVSTHAFCALARHHQDLPAHAVTFPSLLGGMRTPS